MPENLNKISGGASGTLLFYFSILCNLSKVFVIGVTLLSNTMIRICFIFLLKTFGEERPRLLIRIIVNV